MSLKIIETGAIQKLGYGFLFAFDSNYIRICSQEIGPIYRQTPSKSGVTLKTGLGFVRGHCRP